jgi:hypothetical protein
MKKYVFHTDAGHGWIATKRAELIRLGILNKISSYSYQKGETVYLEEDCDASTFYGAKKEKGEEINIRESYRGRSPIRNYESFRI